MRRVVISTIVILATLGGLVLLWQFRLALVLFALSLTVAAVARPATDYWVERGLPRTLALLLTYLIGLLVLAALIVLISRPLLTEIQLASNELSAAYEEIAATWPNGTPFQRAIAEQLPEPERLYEAIAGERGGALIQAIFGVAQGVMSSIAQLAIVLVLSIYWSADRVRFERLWLSILSAEKRASARQIWRAIETGVGAYIRSEMIQSLLAGLLLGFGYQLLGLPYPVLLAISGALFWLIPWLGAALAVILPFLVGFSDSAILAATAAIYTFIILAILEVVVEPRLFNRRKYSSLLVVLYVVTLADAFGLVGLIVAPPLAAATQILGKSLIRISSPIEVEASRGQIARLQQRLEHVRRSLGQEEEPAPEIINLVERISSLIDETAEFFGEEPEESRETFDIHTPVGPTPSP